MSPLAAQSVPSSDTTSASGLSGSQARPFRGTLTVNVVGCFVIGVFAEMIIRRFDASPELRLLLITGFLGGFTTFSAFSLDAISLFERGAVVSGAVYIVASVGLSMVGVIAGLALMRAIL